jgi:hypothetical protein
MLLIVLCLAIIAYEEVEPSGPVMTAFHHEFAVRKLNVSTLDANSHP